MYPTLEVSGTDEKPKMLFCVAQTMTIAFS